MVREKKVLLILKTASFSFLIILITVPALFFAGGCRNDISQGSAVSDTAFGALMTAKEILVLFSDSGRIQARITAPVANRYAGKDPWLEFPQGFLVEMFDTGMRIETTISARYGKRNDVTRIMEAERDVVVRNEKKSEQLNTERLVWEEPRHIIHTESLVRITTPDKVLYGDGLESNESFSNYRILRPRGEMTVPQDSL
jgi:LPS export ABC transporter protein LptC